MSPRTPRVQPPGGWKAIERSVAAQARAQRLREEAERILQTSRELRDESRRLRAESRRLKGEVADAFDEAEPLASAASA
jgi:hypothetical protein